MRFIARILLAVSITTTFAYGQNLPTFQHIIVIVQENRTPDNLFGSNPTFVPGVDIQQPASGQWCLGACFNPDHSHGGWEGMWNHGNGWNNGQGVCSNSFGNDCGQPPGNPAPITYCNGQIVNRELTVPSCPQETYVSSTYDNSVVSPYFDIATKYGFANYFFQTSEGPSMPAHQFLFSGTSAPNGVNGQTYYNYFQAENPGNTADTGCTVTGQTVNLIDPSGVESAKVAPCFDHNSLPTLLDQNDISWAYYGYPGKDSSGQTGIWTAPAAIKGICVPSGGICTGSDWQDDVKFGTAQVLHDLGAGSPAECGLRGVSWVIPNGTWSDHPGFQDNENNSTQIEGGPAWVASIINAVGQSTCKNVDGSSYWNTTAIFVVWDDWGGFWDHVSPGTSANGPGVRVKCSQWGCGYVYGFRVPFLVVSAYTGTYNQQTKTYSGYVSGACQSPGNCQNETFPYIHDFGSILAFIENNFFGSGAIGTINAQNNYRFADNFAPDYTPPPNLHVPLADFFPLPQSQRRPFQAIALPPGAPGADYFLNYNGPMEDPDNDASDDD